MVALTLAGHFTSIALAIVTNWVTALAHSLFGNASQHLSGLIKSAKMPRLSIPAASGQKTISLGSAGSTSFVLTPVESTGFPAPERSSGSANNLMVPATSTTEMIAMSTPTTPVLQAQSGGDVPWLSLGTTQSGGTSLTTSGPCSQNEGLVIPSGIKLWQPTIDGSSKSQRATGKTSLITSSPYLDNEGLKIPSGTPLWQSTGSTTIKHTQGLWLQRSTPAVKTPSKALSMRPMSAPLSAADLITSSPYAQNEGLVIPAGTSLCQPSGAAASQPQTSTGKVSLITSSPYEANEGVAFTKGTALWQPRA